MILNHHYWVWFKIFTDTAPLKNYTIEDLKRHVFNLQWSGIGHDLKQSSPSGVREAPFGGRPQSVLNLHRYK